MTVPMAADKANSPAFGDYNAQESKPSSGFTPLPPIRRTSTFDLLTRRKLGGDEDDRTPSPVGSSDNEVPPAPPAKEGMNYQNGNGQMPNQGQMSQNSVHLNQLHNQHQNFMQPPPQQQHPAFANGQAQVPNGFTPGRGAPQLNGIEQQMYMGRGGPVGPSHQFPQIHGQSGATPMPNQGHNQSPNQGQPFISQMNGNGNPIHKFPPGGQWKLEESHLSEPLIQHKRVNSPQQQQPGYYAAYDKETEDPPISKGQRVQQGRPRNYSGSIPPVSAERFRNHNIFAPHMPDQSQALVPPQTGHPLLRGQTNEHGNQADRGGRDADPNKEMNVHVEEVSVSSVTSDDQSREGRRGSGFFSLNKQNSGPKQGPQNTDQNGPSKDKHSFFGAITNHEMFQPKQKSNLGNPGFPRTSTWDHDDSPEPPSMKKRLSELRGMIKGVGNAKDGAKDDQPAKPSTGYASRPSMQGPIRAHTGFPGQGAPGQPSPLGQPPIGMARSSNNGPRPAESQHAHGEDDHEKKHGRFLGGLFNKQGSKPSDPRQQPNQLGPAAGQRPPQFPVQAGQQFRPGQMSSPGQLYGPHPMYAGQPPPQGGMPAQQGMRRPMVSGQPNPSDNITSPTSPHLLGTAQAVMMRRPSEITVSTQNQQGGTQLSPGQRPPMGSQQGSQTNTRSGQDTDGRGPAQQPGGGEDFSMSSALPKDSSHLSRQSSQERLDVGGSLSAIRTTPNRKPVGSGFSKQDGVSTTSPTRTNDSAPQPDGADDERRTSSHPPSGQQSPTLGKLGHVRQTSLPSPGRPPIPTQPGQVTSPTVGGAQFSPRGPMPSQDRQAPGQAHGVPQGQPGMTQPGQSSPGYPSSSGLSPQHDARQNPQAWGPNNVFSNPQRPGPPKPPRPSGGPTSNPDQHSALSRFFGVDSQGGIIAQPQPPKEAKEKSAASKLLGAFKRGSKQSDPPQRPQQQRPPPGRQIPPHMMRPQQPGQPTPQQPGMARPPISGPSPLPAGPLGPMSSLPPGSIQPGQGSGQMPPPQMQPGRGPMQQPMYGIGRELPPHMQPGGSEKSQQILGLQPQMPGQQRRTSKQQFEPQYDQVPIPRGYEAVHGYGNAGTLAPSPYNVGHPSPPPTNPPFQPFAPQGAPQQQWDPRAMPPQGAGPQGRPTIQLQPGQINTQRQGDSASTTPTPSDQGTFLDMAPTPPPRPSTEEYRFDRNPPPSMPPQFARQQPQVGAQANSQGKDMPTPPSSNWGSAPDSAHSPASQRKHNLLGKGPAIQSKPSDPNISPPSDSGEAPRSQPQHIATAMSTNLPHPQIITPGPPQAGSGSAPNSARPFSPAHPSARQLPVAPAPSASPPQPQPQPQAQDERPGSAAAGRLVSKMSPAANEAPRITTTSLSPAALAERTMSVSPEPPGAGARPAPFHQVSSASLNINVDRANERGDGADDDIYDATPKIGSQILRAERDGRDGRDGRDLGSGQDAVHENTKYAGSERGRPVVNGVGVLGAGVAGVGAAVGAGVAMDTASQEPGPESRSRSESGFGSSGSSSQESTPPQRPIAMNMEPEEKILVDQPVELAAVNDDDDGLPVMSATSYPGQEWNPYGAGEFGDWD